MPEFINCILSIKTKFLFEKRPYIFLAPLVLHNFHIEFFRLIKNYMAVVTSEIMKYYRNFFGLLKITTKMSGASKFASYVTMISNFLIVTVIEFFTNQTSVTQLKLFLFFFTHNQIFVKVLFHYFFTVFILVKNCLDKYISSIFTCKNN